MSKFDRQVSDMLTKSLPSIYVPSWERDWRSTYKHGLPHCLARKRDGDYCQNKRFPGSQFCRTHADIKFQYCSATTLRGHRCRKRPYKDGLCHIHLEIRNKAIFKERIAEIRETLAKAKDLSIHYNR